MDNIKFYSNRVELCEKMDNGNLIAKFIVCDFKPNENNVRLNRSTIKNWLKTLINQPFVGKIMSSAIGDDFSSHQLRVVKKFDNEGKIVKTAEFDTQAFGTFLTCDIETIDNVEYITATCEIWNRFTKAIELIANRIKTGELNTSFEITYDQYHMENDIKVIDNGKFIGLCALGKYVRPAYSCSKLLEVAEEYIDEELSNALSIDISQLRENKNVKLEEKNLPNTEIKEEVVEKTVEEVVETSKNTEEEKNTDSNNQSVETPKNTTENKIIENSNENNNANLGKESIIEQANLNDLLSKKDTALAEANLQIQTLKNEIAELVVYKKKIEKIELEQKEAELAEKRKSLKQYALKSGYITSKELETCDQVKKYIDDVDENGIKSIIAERFMASLDCDNNSNIETSEKDTTVPSVNIYNEDDDDNNYKTIMSSFLNGN